MKKVIRIACILVLGVLWFPVFSFHTNAHAWTAKWVFATGDLVDSSPAIGPDRTIYVGSDDNKLYAVNPDGTEKWTFTASGSVRSSPAMGSNATIFVGSDDDKLYAINHRGIKKWTFATGGDVTSSPVISPKGIIYAGSDDNKLYAIYVNSKGVSRSAWPMFHHDARHTGRFASKALQSLPLLLLDD